MCFTSQYAPQRTCVSPNTPQPAGGVPKNRVRSQGGEEGQKNKEGGVKKNRSGKQVVLFKMSNDMIRVDVDMDLWTSGNH